MRSDVAITRRHQPELENIIFDFVYWNVYIPHCEQYALNLRLGTICLYKGLLRVKNKVVYHANTKTARPVASCEDVCLSIVHKTFNELFEWQT
jgi:hypothetical protein